MADAFVQLSPDSSGKKMDTRTEGTNAEHRQVMVLGDPATNAGVAPVDATKGLAVDLSATGANTNKLLVTPDLPSGAATAAKQPALGVAGTASVDVITVQGKASMTPVLTDASATTQPVSGTVTADTELPAAATLTDADAVAPTVPTVGAYNMIANAGATAATRMRGAGNGLNTTGTGIAAAQIIAQFDDVSPTTISENSFGNMRMSANRNLYGTIRDAAGNERGVNVTSGNALTVDASATTQPVSGTVTANAGTNLNTSALALDATLTGGTQKAIATDGTNSVSIITAGADATSNTFNGLKTSSHMKVFNGTTWDRMPGDTTGINVKSHPVTNAGTFAVQAAVSNLPTTVDTNAGAAGASTIRVVQANNAGKTIVSAGGSAASSGNNTLVAAGTNKLKVFAFSLSTTSTSSTTCIFQSGAGGTELWRVVLQAISGGNVGANLVVTPPAWLFATASATLLNLNLSGANTIHWSVSYYDEA